MMFSRTARRFAARVGARRGFATSPNDVVIVSAARTPIGSFGAALSSLKAPELGAVAVSAAVERASKGGEIDLKVDESYLGNVVGSGMGQAPARQATIKAGLPWSTPCTTVNKVCSSGMKSLIYGALSIGPGSNGTSFSGGTNQCVVVGGFESMSNIPYYLEKGRGGYGFGHGKVLDGVITDGLWDAFDDHHMGNCAEVCAETYGISREDQDEYALESYRRAAESWEKGYFDGEVVPVEVKTRKGTTVFSVDEEYSRLKAEKVPSLRPAFKKDGTVTAANASSLNDGAAALVLASRGYAEELGLDIKARVRSYGDSARLPVEFTVAPSDALPIALENAGMTVGDVDAWEINEAFSAVAIANRDILNIDGDKINQFGGAVAIGHPIGCSGARIIVTLLSVLEQTGGTVGAAGICNGGGGASALVIERE